MATITPITASGTRSPDGEDYDVVSAIKEIQAVLTTASATELAAFLAAVPVAAVADVAALTATTATGTAPAGGAGAAAGGWDTAGHRDTAIATITELVTKYNALLVDVTALRASYLLLLAAVRAAKIVTP